MRFDVITIFPRIFDSYLNESILKRAQKNKLISVKIHNLRDFTKDKHKKVDDRPFGGGPGMVLKAEPLLKAVSALKGKDKKESRRQSVGTPTETSEKAKVILFAAGGKQFDDKMAQKLSKEKNLIMICGRYEGVDERVKKVIRNWKLEIQELSVGPYVLTGGELPAMILIDSVSRKIPGVLGKYESLEEKRFGVGTVVYTRPETLIYQGKKYKVPKVLLSGHHKEIEKWRKSHK